MAEHIIFLIASFLAAIAATVAGFGSSTLMVPVAMFFMDIRTAVFIVACFHLFNNLFKVRLFWKKINVRIAVQFGIPSIIFAFLGAKLISYFPIESLKKFLAVFIIGFSIFSLSKKNFKFTENLPTSLIGGSASGFLAGLIGLGGAIRSMFLVSYNMNKEIYVGTAAVIAMVVDLTRIPTYFFDNVVRDTSYYMLLPFLLVTAYFGVKVGKKILGKVSQEMFRTYVFIALILVGIKFLF